MLGLVFKLILNKSTMMEEIDSNKSFEFRNEKSDFIFFNSKIS